MSGPRMKNVRRPCSRLEQGTSNYGLQG